jgi:hypothetical protein
MVRTNREIDRIEHPESTIRNRLIRNHWDAMGWPWRLPAIFDVCLSACPRRRGRGDRARGDGRGRGAPPCYLPAHALRLLALQRVDCRGQSGWMERRCGCLWCGVCGWAGGGDGVVLTRCVVNACVCLCWGRVCGWGAGEGGRGVCVWRCVLIVRVWRREGAWSPGGAVPRNKSKWRRE